MFLLDFLSEKVFVADLKGSLQLLTSSHLRERGKMLLRAIFMWERVWNGFLLGEGQEGRCSLSLSVGGRMVMVTCFGSVHSSSSSSIFAKLPEFGYLMSLRS